MITYTPTHKNVAGFQRHSSLAGRSQILSTPSLHIKMYNMVNLHVISLMSVGMGKYGYFPPMQFFASFSTYLPMDSGTHFNMHYGVFSQDLAKPRSRKIGGFDHCTPLKFHRHLGSTATKTPVTFQINRIILNVISRFRDFAWSCETTSHVIWLLDTIRWSSTT